MKNRQNRQNRQNMQNMQNMQINMQKNTQGIIKIRIKICRIRKICKTIRKEYADNMQNTLNTQTYTQQIRKTIRKK